VVGIAYSCDGGNLVGNTDVLDGRYSIGSRDGVGDSHWVGNSIGCWYIIWHWDVLGDNGGDMFGLVNWLGDSDIINPLNDVQLRANFSDLWGVGDNGAAKSLNLEGLDILWTNNSLWDGCGDVEISTRVNYWGRGSSIHSRMSSKYSRGSSLDSNNWCGCSSQSQGCEWCYSSKDGQALDININWCWRSVCDTGGTDLTIDSVPWDSHSGYGCSHWDGLTDLLVFYCGGDIVGY